MDEKIVNIDVNRQTTKPVKIDLMSDDGIQPKGEFRHDIRLDDIDRGNRSITLKPSESERAALARRFDVDAIAGLVAMVTACRRSDGVYDVTGGIEADITVTPAAGEEAMDFTVSDQFEEVFATPDGWAKLAAASIDGEVDAELISGGIIDLGEVVAQNLSLALAPVFLEAGALESGEVVFSAGEIIEDGEDNPFSALSALRERLASSNDTLDG